MNNTGSQSIQASNPRTADFTRTWLPDTCRIADNDIPDDRNAEQAAYMQSDLPKSLDQDAEIPAAPAPTEAHAYNDTQQRSCNLTDVPSILQVLQATVQEPSASLSASPMLSLARSFSARSGDIVEPQSLSLLTISPTSIPGDVTSSTPQDRDPELELESIAHCTALPDDHSSEAPYVINIQRPGMTASKTTILSRPQEADSGLPASSTHLLFQASPESRTNGSAALNFGAPISTQGQAQVITTDCGTVLQPANECGAMSSELPTTSGRSTVVCADLTSCAATPPPTSVQPFATQDLPSSVGPSLGDVCTLEAGKKHEVLSDAVAGTHVRDDVIHLDIPSRDAEPTPSEKVASSMKNQDAHCLSFDQEHAGEFIADTLISVAAFSEPMSPGDLALAVSEQLTPQTLSYQPSETAGSRNVAASIFVAETRLSLLPVEEPVDTTTPAPEEDTTEKTSDDTALPVVSVACVTSPAVAGTAEAVGARDVGMFCGPQSAVIEVLHSSVLKGPITADFDLDLSPTNSGITCSLVLTPADAPVDCDQLALVPPSTPRDPQPEIVAPMTNDPDVAGPHLAVSSPAVAENTGPPCSEDTRRQSMLPPIADLVAEDCVIPQNLVEGVPVPDDGVPAISSGTEDTAVNIPAMSCEDSAESGNFHASAANGIAATPDTIADVSVPVSMDHVGPITPDEDVRIPEGLPQSRGMVGIPLADNVRTIQDGPTPPYMLPERSEVPGPQPSTVQMPEDSTPTEDHANMSVDGEANTHAGAHPNVRSPIEAVALPSFHDDHDGDSALDVDVDLADYYAAFPEIENATLSAADFDIAMSMTEDQDLLQDDLTVLEYDLPPSSPPPSSSPPRVFSSPGPASLETTPTSSPSLPSGGDPATLLPEGNVESLRTGSRLPKRMLEEDLSAVKDTSHMPLLKEERQSKRMRTDSPAPVHTPPNPKRPTPASQAKQRKKLAAPFRSPIIKGPLIQGGLHAVYATGRAAIPPPPRKARTEEEHKANSSVALLRPEAPVANKDRTANVAKQFKSPLQTSSSGPAVTSAAAGTFSSVKAVPTIQALQGKVQTLKQAIRIKNTRSGEDEDEVLEGLADKWTTAAREVAWAVWGYVKDLDTGTAPDVGAKSGWFADDDERAGPGMKRGFDPSWGYDDGHVEKRAKLDEDAERRDEKMQEDEEEEPQVVQHTLGVMLRRMGIDPATLGWDEEEGDFVHVGA